jgi:hypothetical protein
MHKFKKAAAVAAMVGGLGLVGSGVASAHGDDYDDPFGLAVDNLQVVNCEQEFDGGTNILGPLLPSISAGGTNNQNIGNFCTVIGSVD